jgi:uncharacterized protein YecE (DUF72 family)
MDGEMLEFEAPQAVQNLKAGTSLVGCAGWSLTSEAMAAFPADGTHLQRYAAVFGAVEINSSFYRSHQMATYARWADSVPETFRFSVKLPRTISHEAKLVDIDELLARFAGEVGCLGRKLGCILVQLAPRHAFDGAIAAAFLARLRTTFDCMIAWEARHPSWFAADASALLARYACTRVQADPPAAGAGVHVPTSAARYLRLHGAPRIYYSPYSDDYLAQLARELARDDGAGRESWVIFDNTASGAALRNALALRVGERALTPAAARC